MANFLYSEMFPLGKDKTEYRLLSSDHVKPESFQGRKILRVSPDALTLLSETAFGDISHFLRPSHLRLLSKIPIDPEASENDRFVAMELLQNSVISAEREFPMCQDTGTAIIMGKKGQRVWTEGRDEKALARGVLNAYARLNLRYSQNAPLSMYEEQNTGTNLPAQIEIYAVDGEAYHFLFIAKGGGSANKSYLFQETRAILNPESLVRFMTEKMKTLGTSACPPYHLVFVVGGTSAEFNLKTVKLASTGYLDALPVKGGPSGHAFRDTDLEKKMLAVSRKIGIGAQFGGKYFCHDVRVIRLPRHGASCPVGMGVSCGADRQVKAKITGDGIFIEKLETNPATYLPRNVSDAAKPVRIDLNRPMDDIRDALSRHPVTTRLLLTGPIVVARDIAHARLKGRLDRGEDLPDYIKDHIIYYAGPAKTPPGYASGSFGPTTAGRMDSYVPLFQAKGGSLVMLAKGNRGGVVTTSCQKHGGFYLGSIGGPAARLGKDCITRVETLAYPELGMEAIYKIEVRDFPAVIIVDDKGNDFFNKYDMKVCEEVIE